MKKIISALLAVMLAGCTAPAAVQEQEPEDFLSSYTELEDSSAFYEGDHDSVEKMLQHGTGILYFSFPECPWCQKYTPLLAELAEEAGVRILYYDIHQDKEDDREWYDAVAAEIDAKNSSISRYDNDGNRLIYMPLVLFLREGTVIGYDDETCDISSSEFSPETYWTEEKKEALSQRLLPLMEEIRASQEEKNSGGCAIRENPDCES